MVIKDLIKNSIETLKNAGCDNAIFEAHQLIREVLNLSATDLVLSHQKSANPEEEKALSMLINRRIGGEPLQYILGTQEFMSLEFKVTPDVLIPRADTETLVEHVLELTGGKGFTLLDIGTGTGCIPLSIANYNRRAFVRGLDISDKAVKIATENAASLRLSERAGFEQLDIMTSIPCGKYDVITSNPPYIESAVIDTLDTTVRSFEPHLALDGGADGLDFYRRISVIAPKLLKKDGLLALEIGYDQGESVPKLLEENFYDIRVIKDLCANDRVVSARLK